MNHVIILDSHVDPNATVLYREISAKSIVPVSLMNVEIVPQVRIACFFEDEYDIFMHVIQGVSVKRSVKQKHVRVLWHVENVILIYVKLAKRICTRLAFLSYVPTKNSHFSLIEDAKMLKFKEGKDIICCLHHQMLPDGEFTSRLVRFFVSSLFLSDRMIFLRRFLSLR